MRQSMAFLNVPSSTSKALRVQHHNRATGIVRAASQRATVRASTAGARPASGRMAGWFMRMISRLIFTSSLRNGTASL